MTESERKATESFILNMERERTARFLSMAEMAELLSMPTSTYKNIVAGNTDKISLPLILRMHGLTGQFLWEMIQVEENEVSMYFKMYRNLTSNQKSIIKSIIKEFNDNEIHS